MGSRPRRACDDLAWRLHHPVEVPRPDQGRLLGVSGPAEPHAGTVFPGGARRGAAAVAVSRHAGDRPGRADTGLRLIPRLLRRIPAGAWSGPTDPGAARLLRVSSLPSHRPRRRIPHSMGTGWFRGTRGLIERPSAG